MSGFRITRLPHGADLPLPAYQSEYASGMDLYACVEGDVIIPKGERLLVPAGVVIALPPGFEGQIRPRSGLALKHGVTIINSPGTIDADYRGELKVLLINHGEDFTLRRGDRIAQLVVARVERIRWEEVPSIDPAETDRGEKGYGSTGTK